MIWFALVIPVLAVLICAIFFTKKMAPWEYAVLFFVPLLTIFIGKQMSIYSQVQDTEYWNSYITKATYYEPWNEYIHKTCSERIRTGTDSKGNATYRTRYYDCSYVQYHSAYWEVNDNIGQTIGISQAFFSQLCQQWSNRSFVDMHRHYHSIDGDAYATVFNNKFENMFPICESHTYENRVQCSKSVFNFQEVDSTAQKRYQLFSYPKTGAFTYNPILGYSNANASLKLQRYNAQLGASKKLHMLLLVFKDQPVDAAVMQENYWKGGNKNEFILCVGLYGNRIDWARVISWTDVEDLKIRVARKVKEMNTFDIDSVINYMVSETSTHFVKKSFKDFSYITVEPTLQATVITFVITLLLSIGLVIFSVKNDCDLNLKNKGVGGWKESNGWPK